VRALSAFTVRPVVESGEKLTRFGPFAADAYAAVILDRAGWHRSQTRMNSPACCRMNWATLPIATGSAA
jgi:hypothetical protein